MKASNFDKILDGKKIQLFTLTNQAGMHVEITNYGAKVVSIVVPDQKKNFVDVVLGYDNIDDYISGHPFFGAMVGRYANRIADGKFSIQENQYRVIVNNGENHLHGGIQGFNAVVWDAKFFPKKQILELSYLSKDGEENYPGNLKVKVTYQLTEKNELKISCQATTDKTTIVNLTHHSYFNLAGEGHPSVLNHRVYINADLFTPVNEHQIPTGEYHSVEDSPMDFREFKPIGRHIDAKDEQIKYGHGYDHNWILKNDTKTVSRVAVVYEPASGRYMEVWTNQPGLQFYTANFLDGSQKGKNGKPYVRRSAFCMETQHFPDSPNQPHFPTTLLEPEDEYNHICIYKFSSKIVK